MAAKKQDTDSFQQFKTALRSGQTAQLYIFHGDEVFLLRHYLAELRKKKLDELTESFNFHRFTQENFSVRDFVDAVEALPMMAQSTFVQVDEVDLFKLPEAEREKIGQVLSDVPDYCTVVFTHEIVPFKPDKRLKSFWSVFEKHAQIVEFAKQSQRELIPWITRHFASHGKRISPELCVYLTELTDGTMTSLQSEIQKISAYSGADAICRADIDAVTEPVLDAVAFQMTGLMGEGEYGKALQKLQQLFKMQEDPIRILGAVGSHFRQIAAARTLIDCGKNSDTLMRLYNMGDYPARKTMSHASKFSAAFCKRASELILETDMRMKSSFDSQERLLELLILQLAQEARNG